MLFSRRAKMLFSLPTALSRPKVMRSYTEIMMERALKSMSIKREETLRILNAIYKEYFSSCDITIRLAYERSRLKKPKKKSKNTLALSSLDKRLKDPPDYYLHKISKPYLEIDNQRISDSMIFYHFDRLIYAFKDIQKVWIEMPEHLGKDIPTAKKHDKKLLLLGLDETLVFSDGMEFEYKDYTFNFHFNDKYDQKEKVFTKVRPYVDAFLETMSQHYEIAVYTTGVKSYAEGVIARLDPEGKFISNIYSREHCLHTRHGIFKEVSKLGRSLKDVVMVDDCIGEVCLDIDNFVPIITFDHEKENDDELLELADFLAYLKDFEDIRKPLKTYFKWYIITKHMKADSNLL